MRLVDLKSFGFGIHLITVCGIYQTYFRIICAAPVQKTPRRNVASNYNTNSEESPSNFNAMDYVKPFLDQGGLLHPSTFRDSSHSEEQKLTDGYPYSSGKWFDSNSVPVSPNYYLNSGTPASQQPIMQQPGQLIQGSRIGDYQKTQFLRDDSMNSSPWIPNNGHYPQYSWQKFSQFAFDSAPPFVSNGFVQHESPNRRSAEFSADSNRGDFKQNDDPFKPQPEFNLPKLLSEVGSFIKQLSGSINITENGKPVYRSIFGSQSQSPSSSGVPQIAFDFDQPSQVAGTFADAPAPSVTSGTSSNNNGNVDLEEKLKEIGTIGKFLIDLLQEKNGLQELINVVNNPDTRNDLFSGVMGPGTGTPQDASTVRTRYPKLTTAAATIPRQIN